MAFGKISSIHGARTSTDVYCLWVTARSKPQSLWGGHWLISWRHTVARTCEGNRTSVLANRFQCAIKIKTCTVQLRFIMLLVQNVGRWIELAEVGAAKAFAVWAGGMSWESLCGWWSEAMRVSFNRLAANPLKKQVPQESLPLALDKLDLPCSKWVENIINRKIGIF